MKHVGKMKNNSAKIVVAYRTIPGDAHSALVVGTQGLADSYHDSLMSLLESNEAQTASELADVLASRRFPDGSVMLNYLHTYGHLRKVPTNLVLMTPNSQTAIPLNELNELIAKQKGISLEDLAVSDGSPKKQEPKNAILTEEIIIPDEVVSVSSPTETPDITQEVTSTDLRSMADKLFKEAQALRRKADELDPPKKKAKVTSAESK
jgi:hypothetical protein